LTDAVTEVAAHSPDLIENGLSAKTAVQVIDLGIAWEWEYDAPFVDKVAGACRGQRLSICVINPTNVNDITAKYFNKQLGFRYFLDRGSDARKEFAPLAKLVAAGETRIINHYSHLKRCLDKATMHLEFLTAGLNVPYTIILSPYKHEPEIKIRDLARLGRSFIIKPAIGGGGTGVVVGAETLVDVLKARQSQNDQKFLLQEKIEPALLADERAWFRAYYVLGKTFLAWWNDITHNYRQVGSKEESGFYLSPMRAIIRKIAKISQLDFFSAEIALTADGRFVVVDYVNDICDMRPQSIHQDGVPDCLLDEIVAGIVDFVARHGFYQPAFFENPTSHPGFSAKLL
jgi:glutathione synthase/RimK-type ligase-like ATP-grasp enzyme